MVEVRDERSLLTESYREYLKEKPEKSDYQRKKRSRMRSRVRDGLMDISLLNQYARKDDIKQIFAEKNDHNGAIPDELIPDDLGELTQANCVHAMHMVALSWQGLRADNMDKEEIFKKVIRDGIIRGEAEYKGVDMGAIEHDIALNTLKIHNKDELDPLEKLEHGLAMSGDDYQELQDRLSNHPDVDKIIDKDIRELSKKYLLDSDSQTDN
jgi:hypothetical protein